MKIGILGAGQLGRMLALAGIPLGLQFRFWDQSVDCPASDVGEILSAPFEEFDRINEFVAGLDCVSYEFENVPVALVAKIAENVPVFPPLDALKTCQDRVFEKNSFRQLSIPSARYCEINSDNDFENAFSAGFPLPAILKSRRFGYDGKGQARINSAKDCQHAWQEIGQVPAILEECIPFEAEVSLISVRAKNGEIRFYPLVENTHKNGILFSSRAPSEIVTKNLQEEAESYARSLLDHFNYIGVLTIEFFLYQGGLVANEMAPRVHNSGHWTIEGSQTSQFENHIRAAAGLPLGSTRSIGSSLLLNLVGEVPERNSILSEEDCHLHLYRKSGRQRRKIGHVTINKLSPSERDQTGARLSQLLKVYQQF